MTYNIRYSHARLSPAKQELLVIEFARRHIDAGDIGEMLEVLAPMVESRENAEIFEGRVTFFFAAFGQGERLCRKTHVFRQPRTGSSTSPDPLH